MTNIFKNLYNYRELLKTSVKKEVRGKYKNSFLGVLWSFLNPLLQITVYAIVFPLILNNKQENYVIFLCCGLIPWTFFATAINRTAFSFVENGNILKKVFFPREIIPISVVTSEAINFLISSLIILGFVVFRRIRNYKIYNFLPIYFDNSIFYYTCNISYNIKYMCIFKRLTTFYRSCFAVTFLCSTCCVCTIKYTF